MFVNPVVFGAIIGCLCETVALLVWAYILGRRK